jgi:hypothetical protein
VRSTRVARMRLRSSEFQLGFTTMVERRRQTTEFTFWPRSKRWVQFGLLSSHSRLHGSDTYRVPWSFDDESSVVLSKFTKLKNRLEPYLTTLSIDGVVAQGHPIMRATFLEFPQDPIAWMVDRQYMLGDALLVAPVFDDEDVEYYVPAGAWVNVLTGEDVDGPRFVNETHSFMTLPLLLRQDYGLIIGREGHLVVDRVTNKDKGFTVVIGRSNTKDFTITSVLRDGSRITCGVKLREGALTVDVIDGYVEGLPWEVLVVGGGDGLDGPSSRNAKGSEKSCSVTF